MERKHIKSLKNFWSWPHQVLNAGFTTSQQWDPWPFTFFGSQVHSQGTVRIKGNNKHKAFSGVSGTQFIPRQWLWYGIAD